MSLLKLLSAGKSLDGSKPTTSPYRMRTGNLLPKFGSTKNPFAPGKTESQSKPAGQMETDPLFDDEPVTVKSPKSKVPAKKETKAAAPEKKAVSQTVTAAPAPAATPAPKQGKRGGLSGLVKKLNPLVYLPKRQPGGRPARHKAARAAVQGELSLERVRVLRNELNDSDLEFVTAKPAGAGTGGAILRPLPEPRLTAWGRLTSRMLGAVETQVQ